MWGPVRTGVCLVTRQGPLGPDGAFDIEDKASGLHVGLRITLRECIVIILWGL